MRAGPRPARPRSCPAAFTLIELLVVIAIIALLLSILLPGMAQARLTTKMLREQVSGNQNSKAWTIYANDNRDAAFTGYIPWAAGNLNNAGGSKVWLFPDPWYPTYFAEGVACKTAGLRWMGASGQTVEQLMLDPATRADFLSRSTVFSTINPSYTPPTTNYDSSVATQAAAMGFHSSFGFNYSYVGGDWTHGAMPNYSLGAQSNIGHPRKKFYVTETSEVLFPSRLLLMASSRGVDVITTGSFASTSYGAQDASWSPGSRVVPGFWEILPPENRFPTSGGGITGSVGPWPTGNSYSENTNPANWGHVHPRHFGQAATIMIDGHMEMSRIEDLRDMRKWANKATTATNYVP